MDKQQFQWIYKNVIVCPVENAFDILGKKFTILILRNMLFHHQTRFNQFLNSINGINAKTLAVRLKEMEGHGLIDRRIFNETPVRVEYELTENGKALKPLLEAMAGYCMEFYSKNVFKDGKPRSFEKVFGDSMEFPQS